VADAPPVDTGARLGSEPDTLAESRALVQQPLDEVDYDKRVVLVLYEIEGMTMREVAMVGCPLQTAYSRLQSGRASLRSAWLRASTSP